jgi:uncharacterized membrane protein HdeD (DUF308 family)
LSGAGAFESDAIHNGQITARQIASGIGALAALVGLLALLDPFDLLSVSASVPIGVALLLVGVYIIVRSAWLARRSPSGTPWNPLLDGDLTGGL